MPWDKDEMLQEEVNFFKSGRRRINARVYVTVGDKEESNMVPLMKQLVKSMREMDSLNSLKEVRLNYEQNTKIR